MVATCDCCITLLVNDAFVAALRADRFEGMFEMKASADIVRQTANTANKAVKEERAFMINIRQSYAVANGFAWEVCGMQANTCNTFQSIPV